MPGRLCALFLALRIHTVHCGEGDIEQSVQRAPRAAKESGVGCGADEDEVVTSLTKELSINSGRVFPAWLLSDTRSLGLIEGIVTVCVSFLFKRPCGVRQT